MNFTYGNKLTIIRGLPGSGKSTLGRRLAEESGSIFIEPDMFCVNKGIYRYTPNRYEAAVRQSLDFLRKANCDVVYADVLPTRADVLRVYNSYFWCQADKAVEHEFRLIALRISVEEALTKNVQHVSEDDLRRMASSWENCIGEERIALSEYLFYEPLDHPTV